MRQSFETVLKMQVMEMKGLISRDAYLAIVEVFCNRYGVSMEKAKKELLS